VKNYELISFASADELAGTVAAAWLDEVEKAGHAGKPYCVALSGGRITQKFFAAVVAQAEARRMEDGGTPSLPGCVHFFWADERCVPPDDPESNFKLARELLFAPLGIPENQIHRIRGEDSPSAAVKAAEEDLRQITLPGENGQPVLNLVFLGMGEDGHVASLFPGAPTEVAGFPGTFLFIENSPKPPPRRVSLSYAAIMAATQVWVLISGAGKQKALSESLDFSGKTPLARVIQSRPNTRIFSEIRPN
jgi:6-phosphogluconolactonase